MSTKHTPGPWEASNGFIQGHIRAACKGGPLIATCAYLPRARDQESANAALIAAAPTLLAALEDALEFIEGYEDVRDGSDGQPLPNEAMTLAGELRRVIAKATGARS